MDLQPGLINGISIVIPNYNGFYLLPRIIPAAEKAAQNIQLPYEIIIVDDCSTDNSVQFITENFPSVKCVTNSSNDGFSKTANVGVKAAMYNWVLLLNSDVILDQDYFKPLLKYTGNKKVFGVTGRIIGWDNNKIQSGAKYPLMQGSKLKTSTDYLLTEEPDMKKGIYSLYLSGANSFFSRDVFLYLGGFNELFSPFYAEDLELSVRAWRLGYECIYEHDAICRHKTSSTIKFLNKKEFIRTVYIRNKMYLHAIHLDNSFLLLWYLQLLGEIAAQTCLFKFMYIRAFVKFLKNYSHVTKSRNRIRKLNTSAEIISLNDIVKQIKLSVNGRPFRKFTC